MVQKRGVSLVQKRGVSIVQQSDFQLFFSEKGCLDGTTDFQKIWLCWEETGKFGLFSEKNGKILVIFTGGTVRKRSFFFDFTSGLEGTSEIFGKNKVQREKWPEPSNGPPCRKNHFFFGKEASRKFNGKILRFHFGKGASRRYE